MVHMSSAEVPSGGTLGEGHFINCIVNPSLLPGPVSLLPVSQPWWYCEVERQSYSRELGFCSVSATVR